LIKNQIGESERHAFFDTVRLGLIQYRVIVCTLGVATIRHSCCFDRQITFVAGDRSLRFFVSHLTDSLSALVEFE